jgi:two-component system OmpR family sensor kinase
VSLRFRLLVAAAVLVAALTGIGYSLIRIVENSQIHQVDRQLDLVLPIAAGITQGPGTFPGNPARFASGRTGLSNQLKLSDMYIGTVDNGQVHTVAAPQAAGGATPKAPPVQSLSGSPPAATTVNSVHGSGRWRAVTLRTFSGRDVLVALYMGPVDATASELRAAVLAAGGVVAAILLACGFWLERLGLRPLAEMKSVADAIAAGDRTRRITTRPRGKEAEHLARALNTMLDKQNEIEDRLLQFVADASHELRTPTSVISGLAQLWRQGDLREGEELEEAMRRVGQESNRMRALVEELLLLARLDSGAQLESQRVDIGRLTRDVLEDATITHPSRQVTARIDDNVVALGDEAALRRVISNLVTNALTHTPSSSAVSLQVQGSAEGATFAISDTGPGMTADEAAHAFERFWRAAPSRTRSGSGLGLSIARAVVEADGGTISLTSTPEAGTTVRVLLPRLLPAVPVNGGDRAVDGEEDRAVDRAAQPGAGDRPAQPGVDDRPGPPGAGDRPAQPGAGDRPAQPGEDNGQGQPGPDDRPAQPGALPART